MRNPLKAFTATGLNLVPGPIENNEIGSFQPPHRWLSNFQALPDGSTVEHYYQAAKSTDADERQAILSAPSPGKAKKLGSDVVHLHPDWDRRKYAVMASLQAYKYSFPELRQMLLSTGDCLIVEGNTWHDMSWGRCLCPEHQGRGTNALGFMIMSLRSSIRAEQAARPRVLRLLTRTPVLPHLL